MDPGNRDPPSPQPPSPPPPTQLGQALQRLLGHGASQPPIQQQQQQWLEEAERAERRRQEQQRPSSESPPPSQALPPGLSVVDSFTLRGHCGPRPTGRTPGYSPCLSLGEEGGLLAGGEAGGAGQGAEGVAEGTQTLAGPRSRSQTPDLGDIQQQQQELPAASPHSRTPTLSSDDEQPVYPAAPGPPAEGEEFWSGEAAEGSASQGRDPTPDLEELFAENPQFGPAGAALPADPVGSLVNQPLMLGGRRQQAKRDARPQRVPPPPPQMGAGEEGVEEAMAAPRPPQDPPQEGTGSSNSGDSSDEQLQLLAGSKRKRQGGSGDRDGATSDWRTSGWRTKY